MISMQGVPSSLILRNESWVRQHAQSLSRRLPSNVERADLIQVGLIAVAQAALGFQWEGDRDTEEARAAFVRYARQRVHGAMLDELRQMDHLSREQRRKVKLVQLARERWHVKADGPPAAADLSALCGLSVDEIFEAEAQAQLAQSALPPPAGADEASPEPRAEAATERDEVEARVDTGILLRRLEGFFATLPERERQVIDAYIGVGLSPTQLAETMNVSPSRLSHMFRSVCERIGLHLGHGTQRATDRARSGRPARFDELMARREGELARHAAAKAWPEGLETVFAAASAAPFADGSEPPLVVTPGTRWG